MNVGYIADFTGGISIVIRIHQLGLLVEKLGTFIKVEENYLLVKRCRGFLLVNSQEGYHVEVTFLLK